MLPRGADECLIPQWAVNAISSQLAQNKEDQRYEESIQQCTVRVQFNEV